MIPRFDIDVRFTSKEELSIIDNVIANKQSVRGKFKCMLLIRYTGEFRNWVPCGHEESTQPHKNLLTLITNYLVLTVLRHFNG